MPIFSMRNKISAAVAKQNRISKSSATDEPKNYKKFVKFAKNDAGLDNESNIKKNKSVATEKPLRKVKTGSKKLGVSDADKKIIETIPEAIAPNKSTKVKALKKKEVNKIPRIKTDLPKNIGISSLRCETNPNPILKDVKKMNKPKSLKQEKRTISKTRLVDMEKRTVGGGNEVQKIKKFGKSSSDIKKEQKVKKKTIDSLNEIKKENMRKSMSAIEKALRINSEKSAMQREYLDHQKSKKEKLAKSRDLQNKKGIKTELKKKSKISTQKLFSPPTDTDIKASKKSLTKGPSDIARSKKKVLKNTEIKTSKLENAENEKNLEKEVKFENEASKPIINENYTINAPEPLRNMPENVLPRHDTLSKTQAAPVPRPDLLKFVKAMKENVKFESLQPGTEPYQDLVQSTLRSVFSTVNKYPRKDAKDPFVKVKNYGKQKDDAFMVTPNLEARTEDDDQVTDDTKLSVAAQMFQRRVSTVNTVQPLERALKECQYAEEKFLEKRKTQAQAEKSNFLKSLHVGPKRSSENSTASIPTVPKDDLKNVPLEIVFPVDSLTTAFDTKAVKMAQRYSSQLEEARFQLSRRLDAL